MRRESIVGVFMILTVIITAWVVPYLSIKRKPIEPMYSVSIVWNNQIIDSFISNTKDSTFYVVDKKCDVKAIVHQIQ